MLFVHLGIPPPDLLFFRHISAKHSNRPSLIQSNYNTRQVTSPCNFKIISLRKKFSKWSPPFLVHRGESGGEFASRWPFVHFLNRFFNLWVRERWSGHTPYTGCQSTTGLTHGKRNMWRYLESPVNLTWVGSTQAHQINLNFNCHYTTRTRKLYAVPFSEKKTM